VTLLKKITKKMKISQSSAISIALYELWDLLKEFPTYDIEDSLNELFVRAAINEKKGRKHKIKNLYGKL
jgi:hypothetical protein